MTQKYRVIGMMSGTSVDGLDIAYCEFQVQSREQLNFQIIHAQTIPYPETLKSNLINSIRLSSETLLQLDAELGDWIGDQVKTFISSYNIEECIIASHGHTVFHQPEKGFTTQIGNGQKIHSKTSFPVIYDFRFLDVSLGGQGAPLVPIGDQLLFSQYNCCINLGGFANISYIEGGNRKAYDIGALNIVLNELCEELGKPFDDGGEIARQHSIIPDLLEELDQTPYYNSPAPKSIGKEWVETTISPILKKYRSHTVEDLIATYTFHIGSVLGKVIDSFSERKLEVLVTGGGSYNNFLLSTARSFAPDAVFTIPDSTLIDFKEAAVFALMGLLRSENQVNCLASVTGADRDSSGGTMIGSLS